MTSEKLQSCKVHMNRDLSDPHRWSAQKPMGEEDGSVDMLAFVMVFEYVHIVLIEFSGVSGFLGGV